MKKNNDRENPTHMEYKSLFNVLRRNPCQSAGDENIFSEVYEDCRG